MLPLDLTKERSISELAREVGELTDALDLLINNAGVLVTGERYGELSAKAFTETFSVNVVGPLLLTQALTPLMTRGESPKVGNLSSDVGSLSKTTS